MRMFLSYVAFVPCVAIHESPSIATEGTQNTKMRLFEAMLRYVLSGAKPVRFWKPHRFGSLRTSASLRLIFPNIMGSPRHRNILRVPRCVTMEILNKEISHG